MNKITLVALDPILTHVEGAIDRPEGINVDDKDLSQRRTVAAQAGRDLQYPADQWDIASQLVRQQ